MKKSFELEKSFKSLNHIPRSQAQKQKTYQNILMNGSYKSNCRENGGWTGMLLTVAMFLLVSAFLYHEIKAPEKIQQAAVKAVDHVAPSEVIGTYMARSDSDHYFSLQSNITRKGVLMQEEKVWRDTIRKALSGMERVPYAQDGQASYDLLIIFNAREAAKYKLWISGEELYLKDVKANQFYKVGAEQAVQIIETIARLEKQVLF